MEAVGALKIGLNAFLTDPSLFLLMVLGVFLGMIMGAIPGLTATLAVTMALPFTYLMSPSQGLTTLVGIYVGGISGGLIAATLLNIPGTPASLVTCFDGSPMARKGRAADALGLGVFASLIGGLFSAAVLVVVAPTLARAALLFGPWEYFALGIMGYAVIISVCSADLIKGCIAAIIGLLLAVVGYDPICSVPRMMFGFWQLGGGLDVLATLMGLFAVVEVMGQSRTLGQDVQTLAAGKLSLFPRKELFWGREKAKVFVTGSIIGTLIGILPGIGQTTASLMSYNTALQTSPDPKKYGTGCEEGVIASETANNAVCGGALIPMLTLGIPGDLTTAVMLGGLVIHGLTPGPLLFVNNKEIVGIIFVVYILSCIVMYFMEMGLMNFFIKTLSIPMNILFPIILVMCVVGTLTTHNRIFDCWVLVVIGLLGYVLVHNGFPLPPIVLGYILGPIIENNFRTGVIAAKGNVFGFIHYPIAMTLLVISAIMIAVPEYKRQKARRTAEAGQR